MSNYFLGIDHGTGGAKVCIINEEAHVAAYAAREYPIYTPEPGWSEHDPADYWSIACQLIRQCLEEAGVRPHEIRGIANSSALPSLVMVDKRHRTLNMAYNLMDRRATEQVQWLKDTIGDERIFNINCNRLEDHSTLVNLMWEKENRPQTFAEIDKALTIDGFIRLKLTGESTANFSSGAFYGVAYDVRKNEIDHALLEEIGLTEQMLPEFFPCEAIVGYTTAQAAEETGLVPGIPVAAGSVDCNAGWLGGGAIAAGDVQVNLGTCGVIGVVHQDPEFMLDTMINCSYTTNSRNTFVTIAATTTGGQCMRYLRDNYAQLEMACEKLVPEWTAYQNLDRQAEKVGPGSDGLIVLPYLMGERTPLWDADARGVVFGLSLQHSKAHLARAMMEGVAYAMYKSYVILEARCQKINLPLVLNEGGAGSRLWRTIITDVFNVPTVVVKNRAGAPMGDAILAGVASGFLEDFSVAKERAEYVDRLEPDAEHHGLYMDLYALQGDIYEHLKGDFTSLAALTRTTRPAQARHRAL